MATTEDVLETVGRLGERMDAIKAKRYLSSPDRQLATSLA